MKFIDLNPQYTLIKKNIELRIKKVLEHGQFIQGPEVFELEKKLAAYVGVKHCVSCANGTDALQIVQMALGIGPGDEVITPAFTYVSTAETIALLGATPVFVDVDPETFCIDVSKAEACITKKTKAIIGVSLYGQCADFLALNKLAKKYNIKVIEDAAQSFGATSHGQRSCNLTDVATTSFFPSKPLGCYGDGGAVFTNDSLLAEAIRQIASHGQEVKYKHIRLGVNSRLDTIQATVLLEKLNVFDTEVRSRNKVAEAYSKNLTELQGVNTPLVLSENKSVWAQYTLKSKNRDSLIEKLKDRAIPSGIYYPIPLHHQKAFNDKKTSLPVTEVLSQEVLSLPMHPYLSEEQISKVCEALKLVN